MAFLDISNQTIDGAIVGIGLKSARRIAAKVLTAATPATTTMHSVYRLVRLPPLRVRVRQLRISNRIGDLLGKILGDDSNEAFGVVYDHVYNDAQQCVSPRVSPRHPCVLANPWVTRARAVLLCLLQ